MLGQSRGTILCHNIAQFSDFETFSINSEELLSKYRILYKPTNTNRR